MAAGGCPLALQKQAFHSAKAGSWLCKSSPLTLWKQAFRRPTAALPPRTCCPLTFFSFHPLLLNDDDEMGDDIAHYTEQPGRTNYLKPSAPHFLPFYFLAFLPLQFTFLPFFSLRLWMFNLSMHKYCGKKHSFAARERQYAYCHPWLIHILHYIYI